MTLNQFTSMPVAASIMTPFPHTVSLDTPVPDVLSQMEEGDFRHLPVIWEGAIVGIISLRDIDRMMRDDTVQWVTTARDVMTADPYVVEPAASFSVVLREMEEQRIGTALVADEGKLVGIITLLDVCRVLAEVLEERFPPGASG
jgi:acetoin utilization protein AcuB